jgi:hypothetical protein
MYSSRVINPLSIKNFTSALPEQVSFPLIDNQLPQCEPDHLTLFFCSRKLRKVSDSTFWQADTHGSIRSRAQACADFCHGVPVFVISNNSFNSESYRSSAEFCGASFVFDSNNCSIDLHLTVD